MKEKPRGRPKGGQNKASKSLREALQALKFDLPTEFLKLYNDEKLPLLAKLRLLETLLQYTHPKLKEQELPPAPLPVTPASSTATETLLSLAKTP